MVDRRMIADVKHATGSGRRPGRPERPKRPARPATLAIALGAVLGTGARAWIGLAVPLGAGGWPWGTLGVNVLGALVLGAALGAVDRGRAPSWLRGSGFTTGVVGSFTTFSTLAVEAGGLAPSIAVAYAAVTLAGGLGAAALGRRIGRGPA